jgi:hypothetical protein
MSAPVPTPILRFIHVDNLHIYLQRGGLHAPNYEPADGLVYRTIHNEDIQASRRIKLIPCGPQGTIHDYVPFYFAPWSPMMLLLKSGWVPGYNDGQEPLIYLVSTAQIVCDGGNDFVFSDGHGVVAFTKWFADLTQLDELDWEIIKSKHWADDPERDMDRKRRKQAEFLIHQFCEWSLIQEIVVIDDSMRAIVEAIMSNYPSQMERPVRIKRNWYY